MDCATVFCDIDDRAIMLSVTRPKARKQHKCTECKRIIAKGEQYLCEKTLYVGTIETWKTCQDCESIRDNLFSGGYYYGEIIYMLNEHIHECDGDISESIISKLTAGAMVKVCTIIEEVWENLEELEY